VGVNKSYAYNNGHLKQAGLFNARS